MMNHNVRTQSSMLGTLVRRGLLFATLLLAGAGLTVACDDPDANDPDAVTPAEDDEVEARSAEPNCCEWGYWECPTDHESFEYTVQNCPGAHTSQARTACEAYCSVTCTNHGWFSGC